MFIRLWCWKRFPGRRNPPRERLSRVKNQKTLCNPQIPIITIIQDQAPVNTINPRLPPPCAPKNQPPDNPRHDRHAPQNSHADQPFLLHLLVNQALQALRLQVLRLEVQQQLVVAAGFGVGPEFVVAEGEVVEAFAAALRRVAEDVAEEEQALLLVRAGGGFDEALGRGSSVVVERERGGVWLFSPRRS